MGPRRLIFAAALVLALCPLQGANAATLRLSPVTLEMPAGANAGLIGLRNEEATPVTVQARIFRWRQENGEEWLEPATDVVASPPIVTMAPRTDYQIRIVRLASAPASGESYRVLIDEIPSAPRSSGAVALTIRYSVPVFFGIDNSAARLDWQVVPGPGGPTLRASNQSSVPERIADLQLRDGGGRLIAGQEGLVGYVLPGATMGWPLAGSSPSVGGSLRVTAVGRSGPINGTATVVAR